MSVIASAVKHMLAAGMNADAIVAAVEAMEAATVLAPTRTARQERNSRYYQNRRDRLNASEKRLNKTDSDVSDASKESPPAPPKEIKNPPSGVKKTDEAENLIERLKTIYPRRNHTHPWSKAKPIFAKQLRNGACADDICRAAEAYAAKVRREGKEGTEFVKQITSFAAYWQDVLADQPAARKLDPGWPLTWDRETCRRLYLAGSWPPGIGCPAPGEPGCKVPPEIQEEWAAERQRAA